MDSQPQNTNGPNSNAPIGVTPGHREPPRDPVEEASRPAEFPIRAILDAAADGIITVDETGRILLVNRAAERLFGYRADELIGQDVSLLIPQPQTTAAKLAVCLESLGDSSPFSHEARGRRKDGSTFAMELAVSRIDLADRRIYAGLIHDVTDRKQLEREVLELGTHEQQRIGRELHDVLGQELTGLSYLAKNLQRKLENLALPEAKAAGELVLGLQRAIGQVRSIAKGLVPSQVDAQALVPALHALASSVEERYAVACRLHSDGDFTINSHHKAIHLYRIAQEAVRNAVKHGRAQNITLELSHQNGQVVLTVRDDGLGVGPESRNTAGMGMRIMQYRARLIGGSFEVHSLEGGGTRVVCSVHQDDPNDEEHE